MKLGDFDDIQDFKDPIFYSLVEILRNSTPKELKKYFKIIKTIKED